MNFSGQYFADAQKVIMGVLKEERAGLIELHGKVEFELKDDNSVVTDLDKKLENILKDRLAQFDGGVGFWGEEHGKQGNDQQYWLIDPIDGTESFIRGLSGSRNMLTFVDGDKPLFALVYRFTTDDLYIAEKGRPTTKNNQPVKLSDRPLNRSWFEFSVNLLEPDAYDIYKNLRPQIAGITVHMDFLNILDGAIEGIVVYKSGGSVWDYAPRALLIESAGGKVANIGSEDYNIHDNNMIACSPTVYDEVKRIIDTSLKA